MPFVSQYHPIQPNYLGRNTIPPVHILNITVGQGPVLHRYWDMPYVAPTRRHWRNSYSAVESSLLDSVNRCLDADVPFGVFLSGGVDSFLVAALASRHQPCIDAFSLGFSGSRYSELPNARHVAEHLGLTHHTIQIGVNDVVNCLPHLVVQYGQPFGDASAVPSYLVAHLSRQHVKVCLSGDGDDDDESFGGYWRVQSGVYAARYGKIIPRSVR